MVKMLTVLVSTISNSQVFLLKNVSSVCKMQKLPTFLQQKILVYMQYLMIEVFNEIVSFEQLGHVY